MLNQGLVSFNFYFLEGTELNLWEEAGYLAVFLPPLQGRTALFPMLL